MELLNKIILFILIFSILQLLANFISLDVKMRVGKNSFLDNFQSIIGSNMFHHFENNSPRRRLNEEHLNLQQNSSNLSPDYGFHNSYYFISNVTAYQYQGTWTNAIPTRRFQSNSGNMLVSMSKLSTVVRFIENIENSEVLYVSILIYDGSYIDNWMNFTFNLHLGKGFSKDVYSKKVLSINNPFTTVSKVIGQFNDQLNFTSNNLFI